MPDAKLVTSWKITEALLERGRHALPTAPAQHEQASAALLAQYRECLEHNDLGLALDILEEPGHLISARGGFWRDLERAAENMGLLDRLPAIRKAFSDALERSRQRARLVLAAFPPDVVGDEAHHIQKEWHLEVLGAENEMVEATPEQIDEMLSP